MNHDAPPAPSGDFWLRWLGRTAPLLMLVGGIVGLQVGEDELIRIRDAWGPWAPLATITIQALVSPTPLPSDVVAIAHGSLFNYLPAVIYTWIGWMIGAVIEFQVVRLFRRPTAARAEVEQEVHRHRWTRWLHRFPTGHPAFLILGRQIPGLGAHVTIIAAAATGVSWKRFLICCSFAVIPGSLVMPAVGAGLLPMLGQWLH